MCRLQVLDYCAVVVVEGGVSVSGGCYDGFGYSYVGVGVNNGGCV